MFLPATSRKHLAPREQSGLAGRAEMLVCPPPPCGCAPLSSSLPETLTLAIGPEALWMRWAEIKGGQHMVHWLPGGQPSPCHATGSPEPRTLGEVGREPAFDVLGKTAEWEDLGDARSICLIVPGGSRGSGPGRKGPQTYCRCAVFGEVQASPPGTLSKC